MDGGGGKVLVLILLPVISFVSSHINIQHPSKVQFKLHLVNFSQLSAAAVRHPEHGVTRGWVMDCVWTMPISWISNISANLEEEGVHYEGDMILPDGSSKVAISNPAARWPNGVVPYVIEGIWPFGFSEQNIRGIMYFFIIFSIFFRLKRDKCY